MLELTDARWKDLPGGYRLPYDASMPLQALLAGQDAWAELWNELHHQGDVDEASYAAAAKLIELGPSLAVRNWNFYGLIALIEVARHRHSNPSIPAWLLPDYESAWRSIVNLASRDLATEHEAESVQAILAVLALAKGALKLGALIVELDSSELNDLMDERCDWTEEYRS